MREDFKGNLIMCKIRNVLFSKKIIIILFKNFPHFFSWKNTTCLSILILTLWNTTLNNTREFFILKNICKKKTGKIFGGRNSLFLTRVFCFQNSVFSVSHYFPHLAVPVFEQKRAKTKVWLFIIFFAFRFVNSVVEIWNVIVSVSSSFLIKNHLVFQTNGIKLWKSQKPSQQKFKGSKNIFW